MQPSPEPPADIESLAKEAAPVTDNYEEVEMDIDSDPGSPCKHFIHSSQKIIQCNCFKKCAVFQMPLRACRNKILAKVEKLPV